MARTKQTAAINRQAAQHRRKQETPRSLLDKWLTRASSNRHMGGARTVQGGNGTDNSRNIDANPTSPRAMVDSTAQSWGLTF